jgi:predicted AlkP superfamily pyrophosphatase or phosphodiesterase
MNGQAGHVLVIGVDGVRFDLLNPVTTPSLWDLGRAGFLTAVLLDESTPSWSAPSWATIATGTGVAGHAITSNDMTGNRLADHPDFLTQATRAGLSTMLAVGGWAPLALGEDGGPLFAEATRREFIHPPDKEMMPDRVAAWDAADAAVTERAAEILAGDAPRVSFVYLGAVDIAGHLLGAGEAYRAAARTADHRIWRLRATLRSRPDYADEDWTVIAVTDHGHLDAGGHGGREPEVVTAWAAAAGPAITPGGPPLITRQTDVAPLVLAAAGLAGTGPADLAAPQAADGAPPADRG